LPALPGVYLMKDAQGEVIYVGKAVNLHLRVKSYFTGGDGRFQIEFLMKRVRVVEKIVTESEEQAFVLERDLISKYKPRYNIRLKDDRAFLSIRIDENSNFPRLELTRRPGNDGARNFGPYAFSYELRTILDVIKRVVPLRNCTDTVFYNRQRPCLEYQIKRCSGPCCLDVSREDYGSYVKQAIAILEGRTGPLIKELEGLMELASEDMRYEDAALCRDRIEVLRSFSSGVRIISSGGENRDVFALFREEKLAALSVLQVRGGRISDSSNFSFTQVEISNEEVLESAVEQFYEGSRPVPEEIILPFQLENESFLKESLKKKRGARVDLKVPRRGIRYRLLGLAGLNAKEHYVGQFEAEARYMDVSRVLAREFKLGQIPRRIECVDISNLQGTDIVGALVVFFDGVPDRKAYKKYVISQQGKPDDFAAINEVVSRRLKKGLAEDDLPDLLIIDGGAGQLSAALKARDDHQAPVEIISMAKKPERIFLEVSETSLSLAPRSETTHFLQRVRDEAHRFVISFHRKTRAKRASSSMLDGVRGIGPERKRRLLTKYGSISVMQGVSVEELAETGRMSLSLAGKLAAALREHSR